MYRSRHPKAPTTLITRAYEVAHDAHRDQRRKSGEAYITHPLAVATIVAGLGLDDVTLAAALLHDAVEDTGLTLADVERDFGSSVAELVDGVTKLERLEFDSKEQQQAASMRKMLLAMARDLRVVIIKLADRLHNMRTIAALPDWKQQRIARETIDIYSPLAHRLGMQDLKQQLEDLAFATLYPRRFAEIDHMVSQRAPERDLYLFQVLEDVRGRLEELRIQADVTGRPKHLWSIYEKMVVRGKGFDEIFDLVGIRVTVGSVKDCYAALGSIHATWKPVQGRFKDYIAQPKFNLYQSLHTTVIGPQGKTVEVQIRTQEMHQRAELGVAAHWTYKGSGDDMVWLNRIVDWQSEISDPERFLEVLKIDLEQDEVYVFTPKGLVITLARGATPIDFAYAIHTEVGHACVGAKVNSRLVSLDHQLESGDTCEIFTSRSEGVGPEAGLAPDRRHPAGGQQDPPVVLPGAAGGRPRDRAGTTSCGRCAARASRSGSCRPSCSPRWPSRSTTSTSTPCTPRSASTTCRPSRWRPASRKALRSGDPEQEEQLPTTARTPRKPRDGHRSVGVHVEGLDDVMVHLSRCCTPVPDDEIMGFVTRGRGVSVHRADCANARVAHDRPGRPADRGGVGRGAGRHVRRRHRAARPRPPPRCSARSPRRSPRSTSTSSPASRGPGPTASRRCASTSSSPTRPTSTRSCAPSSASTASTRSTGSCPARADRRTSRHRP